ncbi:unnamed protein product [Brassica oleracea]
MGYRYSTKNKPCTYDETKTCKPALMVKRYELMVQHARGVIKTYEGTLRFLDESDKELVQLEGYNKMIEYWRASN